VQHSVLHLAPYDIRSSYDIRSRHLFAYDIRSRKLAAPVALPQIPGGGGVHTPGKKENSLLRKRKVNSSLLYDSP
jgi:hypothetical protein